MSKNHKGKRQLNNKNYGKRNKRSREENFSVQVKKKMPKDYFESPEFISQYQFDNPYNFVPAMNRAQHIKDAHLGDHLPTSHHAYHKDHWSGKLTIEMTVATPLLIPNAAQATTQNDHVTLPIRKDVEGNVQIPVTSFKGTLRSAFEAITNSRLGIFRGHDEKLIYRLTPTDAPNLFPVRILYHQGQLCAELMVDRKSKGDIDFLKDKHQHAAWLPRYIKNWEVKEKSKKDKGESIKALKYPDGNIPKHGDKVYVQLEKDIPHQKKFTYNKVTAIQKEKPIDFDKSRKENPWYEGWVYVSGPNINNKHEERVFIRYDQDVDNSKNILLDDGVIKNWTMLLKDYQDLHVDDIKKRLKNEEKPTDYFGDEPGKTAFSRHIYTPEAEQLKEGDLCYAQIVKSESSSFQKPEWLIKALYPVSISRIIYEQSPDDLLPKNLHPASSMEELSPADRLFGWVKTSSTTTTAMAESSAYKGKIRFSPIQASPGQKQPLWENVGNNGLGLPLAILGKPKEQQARFYVAKNTKGESFDNSSRIKFFTKNQGLRGRKVYPHQPQTTDLKDTSFWDFKKVSDPKIAIDYLDETPTINAIAPVFQEYRRMNEKEEDQRDSQNRSHLAWVKPGSRFQCTLDLMNLSDFELGTLFWLLTLNDDKQNNEDKPQKTRYFRFGGGKPLGFGSVTLDIKSMDLRNGQAEAQHYRHFSLNPSNNQAPNDSQNNHEVNIIQNKSSPIFKTYRQMFLDAVIIEKDNTNSGQNTFAALHALKSQYSKLAPYVKAFINACEGGQRPVHYPRTSVNPKEDSNTYEWFTQNQKKHRKRFLPSLEIFPEEKGLKIYPCKNQKK